MSSKLGKNVGVCGVGSRLSKILICGSADKKLIKLAWRIAIDWCAGCLNLPFDNLILICFQSHSYRTLLPLLYPPHTLAIGSLYVAALLLSFEQPQIPDYDERGRLSPAVLAQQFSTPSTWMDSYRLELGDVDGMSFVCLLISLHTHYFAVYRICTHHARPFRTILPKSIRQYLAEYSIISLTQPFRTGPA